MSESEQYPRGSRVLVAMRVNATPARAFVAFTDEVGAWWRPNQLFPFDTERTGTLAFEGGGQGRLVERYDDGSTFTIGHVRRWEPPHELVVDWRQGNFAPDETTELHVRFESVADGVTRVVVEHVGWDTIPAAHAARHGFPLGVFQQRFAEWWQQLLAEMARSLG